MVTRQLLLDLLHHAFLLMLLWSSRWGLEGWPRLRMLILVLTSKGFLYLLLQSLLLPNPPSFPVILLRLQHTKRTIQIS